MKKRWLFILAVLMITATVFVACNSEVADANVSAQPGEELVYASFGGSKALTTEYNFIDYTQLYWFYQAEKKDAYGRTGAVTGTSWAKVPGGTNRRGLDGTVGPFSQGLWAFALRGYQTESTTQPTSGDYASVTIGQTTYYYTNLVYSGTSTGTGEYKNEVNLKYGNSNAIPVTVAPSGATGKIALGTSTAPLVYSWYQSNGGTGALKLKVTVTPQSATSATDSWDIYYDLNSYQYYGYIYAKNSTTSTDLPTGNYNLVFTVCAVETVDQETVVAYEFAKQALSATVFGSQTTYVKGNLVEGLFVENAHFVATDVASKIVIANDTSASEFTVDPTPVGKSVSGKQTTVSIPAGELTSGTQNNMTIEVVSVDTAQDVATAVDFVIEDPTEGTANIAVAAIDITLKQVTTTTDSTTGDVSVEETSVKNFTQPVTITTYISPNLSSVKVRYNVPADAQEGDDTTQPKACKSGDSEYTENDQTTAHVITSAEDAANVSILGYYPETGLLRFQTTHFSQFFVISDSEAQNVTTGVYYSTLKEAFEKAENNQTIKLLKSTVSENSYTLNYSTSKNLVFDLNGLTLTTCFDIYNISLEIKNGTLSNSYCPVYLNEQEGKDLSKLIIDDNATVTGVYSVILWGSDTANGMVLDVYGTVYGVVWPMGNITAGDSEINVYSTAKMYGVDDDDEDNIPDMCIANQGQVKTTIYDGATLTGGVSAIEVRAGEVNILGGTFSASMTPASVNPNGSGTTTKGAAVAVAQHTTKLKTTVNISGGSFEGYHALYISNPESNAEENVTVSVSGGTFSKRSNTESQAAVVCNDTRVSKFITGGVFNTDPTDYVAPGYKAVEEPTGNWTVVSVYGGGSGTENDPYLIKDASHVEAFYSDIEKENTTGVYYKLGNNIAIVGGNASAPNDYQVGPGRWEMTAGKKFKGNFDGNNNTIYFSYAGASSTTVSLFNHIEDATIKNLNVVCDIDNTSSQWVAAVCMFASNSNISNVNVSGSIKSHGDISGLCYAPGDDAKTTTVNNCTVTANLTNVNGREGTTSKYVHIGLFAAQCLAHVNFTDCSYSGTVKVEHDQNISFSPFIGFIATDDNLNNGKKNTVILSNCSVNYGENGIITDLSNIYETTDSTQYVYWNNNLNELFKYYGYSKYGSILVNGTEFNYNMHSVSYNQQQ